MIDHELRDHTKMYIHEYHIIDSVLVDIRNKNSNLEASRTKIAKMRSKENRGIDRYLAYNRRIKLLFWSINTNIQKIIPEESHHIVYSITISEQNQTKRFQLSTKKHTLRYH